MQPEWEGLRSVAQPGNASPYVTPPAESFGSNIMSPVPFDRTFKASPESGASHTKSPLPPYGDSAIKRSEPHVASPVRTVQSQPMLPHSQTKSAGRHIASPLRINEPTRMLPGSGTANALTSTTLNYADTPTKSTDLHAASPVRVNEPHDVLPESRHSNALSLIATRYADSPTELEPDFPLSPVSMDTETAPAPDEVSLGEARTSTVRIPGWQERGLNALDVVTNICFWG